MRQLCAVGLANDRCDKTGPHMEKTEQVISRGIFHQPSESLRICRHRSLQNFIHHPVISVADD